MDWDDIGTVVGTAIGVAVGAAAVVATGGAALGVAAATAAAAGGVVAGGTTGATVGGVVGKAIGTAASTTLGSTTAKTAATFAHVATTLMPPVPDSRKMILLEILARGSYAFCESFVDNVVRDNVVNIPPGAIVYCDLLTFEHSGVYIGDGNIVHLDGSGNIICTSGQEFLNRLDGFNQAISIYASCVGKDGVGSLSVANYAESQIGNHRNYNLVLNNCHKFSLECLLEDASSVPTVGTLRDLKYATWDIYGTDTWRVWDYQEC